MNFGTSENCRFFPCYFNRLRKASSEVNGGVGAASPPPGPPSPAANPSSFSVSSTVYEQQDTAPPNRRTSVSSRPMSMIQTYQPPIMEVGQDTLPELQRIHGATVLGPTAPLRHLRRLDPPAQLLHPRTVGRDRHFQTRPSDQSDGLVWK